MQRIFLLFISLLFTFCGFSQETDTTITDRNIKSKVLSDIQLSLETKTRTLDSSVIKLDKKVDDLDKAIANSRSAYEKADKLLERVQSLEKRQFAIEENELNVYQANYQSAIINLVSMDREIKPLLLFNSSREFFAALTETSNPTSYPGYRQWYQQFTEYVNNERGRDASLNVLGSLLTLTGDISKGTPFTGPLTQSLFSGISSFISSLGRNRKELRDQSEQMFLLTAKIAQFTNDKNLIENEWGAITKELDELQKQYDVLLKQNLKLLQITENDFKNGFSRENDANKRYEYLSFLKQKSAKLVTAQKSSNAKDWKEEIYFELTDVQALKLNFGRTTFRISENIESYKNLIQKYKSDPEIGTRVVQLQDKLTKLKQTFDQAFDPLDYINSATRMYKVN